MTSTRGGPLHAQHTEVAVNGSTQPQGLARPTQGQPATTRPGRLALQAGVLQAGALQAGALQAGALQAGALQAGALHAGALQAGALQAGASFGADGGSARTHGEAGAPDIASCSPGAVPPSTPSLTGRSRTSTARRTCHRTQPHPAKHTDAHTWAAHTHRGHTTPAPHVHDTLGSPKHAATHSQSPRAHTSRAASSEDSRHALVAAVGVQAGDGAREAALLRCGEHEGGVRPSGRRSVVGVAGQLQRHRVLPTTNSGHRRPSARAHTHNLRLRLTRHTHEFDSHAGIARLTQMSGTQARPPPRTAHTPCTHARYKYARWLCACEVLLTDEGGGWGGWWGHGHKRRVHRPRSANAGASG